MSANDPAVRRDPGYTGLTKCIAGLPASYYYDEAHYRQELARLWYANWVYACRSNDIQAPRSYQTFELGDQSILLVRGEDGIARGFHNTCRHRGSVLSRAPQGRFPPAGIVCPYHSWRYDFRGKLLQCSSRHPDDGFALGDYPLYEVATKEWNGFIFVSLAKTPPAFGATFDQPLNRLDDWRLSDLVVGHTFSKTVACNWKVFWENYNECLHCPGVHPRLAQLVPLFGRAFQDAHDDPHWRDHADDSDPKYRGGLRKGAQSWSMNGMASGVLFPNVSAEDRKTGHVYITCLPSAFIVAHVDYVRIVRLRPLSPEQTELNVEFLFLPETLSDPAQDIMNAVEFTRIVMTEDAGVCELNQRGLHSVAHAQGVVMPEEYMISSFQEWIRSSLAQDAVAAPAQDAVATPAPDAVTARP